MEFSTAVFKTNLAPTSSSPYGLTIARAEGIYLYTPDGTKYRDMISGIGVSSLGHARPEILEAIHQQVDKHLHVMVYGEFVQSAPNLLAYRLSTLLPDSLNCTYLVNSGTEANEGALKLAKRLTNRTELIACKKSYHGSTHGSLSVSGNEFKKQAFRPLLPDVRFIEFNNPADLHQITHRTAAVIIETIQGDAGVRIPDQSYLQALRTRCTETGAMLIFDEIQCGLGRTGKLFAFEHYGIVPDILTLGKALGGGLPIGAFIASHERMQALTSDPMLGHITTFGGNPVCAAAANATLKVMTETGVLETVEAKGRYLETCLQHPAIKEIRRKGLMLAVDFESEEIVSRIVANAKHKGLIAYWFLSHPYSFRLAPPLTITMQELQECGEILLAAINESV